LYLIIVTSTKVKNLMLKLILAGLIGFYFTQAIHLELIQSKLLNQLLLLYKNFPKKMLRRRAKKKMNIKDFLPMKKMKS